MFHLKYQRRLCPSHPASKHNLPYVLPPRDTQKIASHVLFGDMIEMTIGSRGTIIYVDKDLPGYEGLRLVGNRMDESDRPVPRIRESSEYHSTEQDDWTSIALQEEEGTIAIGDEDGRIVVFDYA